jgi:hypothetical protein
VQPCQVEYSDYTAAYLSLPYVLLFPHGDMDWHWGLRRQHRSVDITQQSDADGLRENAEPENLPDFAAAAEEGIPLITPLLREGYPTVNPPG